MNNISALFHIFGYFPVFLVIVFVLSEIRMFRVYRRVRLTSYFLLLVGGGLSSIGVLGGIVTFFVNMPDITSIRCVIPFVFFILIALAGGVLIDVGSTIALTKELGVLRELRKQTTWLQWRLGDVPRIERNIPPPIGKNWKWAGIATGVGIIIIPRGILALSTANTTNSTATLIGFLLNLVLGGLLIGFSTIYFKES